MNEGVVRMQQFKNTNQFRSFMKKEAVRLNLGIRNTYNTFVSRCFLEKLSKYNDGHILIKGSSSETAYLGRMVRGITDIDIATINGIEECVEIISRAIEDDSTMKFVLKGKPKITPTGIYKMSFDASIDKTKHTLGVDLQDNYKRLIEKEKRMMPPIFEGDQEFKILVPSFEEYLAEKLCIILESNKPDLLNTRVKDFYDIYQLHGGQYDPQKLTKYFKKMLRLRGKIKLQDATTEYLDKEFIMNHQDIWKSTKEKYDFIDSEIDLYGAVYYTRAVLREELQKNGIKTK